MKNLPTLNARPLVKTPFSWGGRPTKEKRLKKGGHLARVLWSPGESLLHLSATPCVPVSLWIQCAAVAVLGSLFFGLSLVRVQPELDPAGSALWFTLSAGGAWVLFGPILRLVTGLPWKILAQACLVTMVYGEVVLVTGACFQSLLGTALSGTFGLWVAAGWILFSNLIMASALAAQLAAMGIPLVRSLLLWIFGLNGLGAAFFFLLRSLAGGGL